MQYDEICPEKSKRLTVWHFELRLHARSQIGQVQQCLSVSAPFATPFCVSVFAAVQQPLHFGFST
jgi:hypothetical protein